MSRPAIDLSPASLGMVLGCRRNAARSARGWRTQAPLVRNPALGEILADFAGEADATRRELEEILRAGGRAPASTWPVEAGAHIRGYLTALRGDEAVARAGLEGEKATLQAFRDLLGRLQEDGAEADLLQEVADMANSVGQRAHIFAEILDQKP